MTSERTGSPPVLDRDVVDALGALSETDPVGFVRELFAALIDQGTAVIALCAGSGADATAVAAAGHTLKGAAGTVGAMRLSAAAEALEMGAHDLGRRQELLRSLEAELELVRTSAADRLA